MERIVRPVVMFAVILTVAFANAQVYTITDLGTLPTGTYSEASAINSFGQVVGTSSIRTGSGMVSHAFLWTRNGGMQDLGTLPGDDGTFSSWGTGINDLGQVVGGSWQDVRSNNVFLWTRTAGMQNLEGAPTMGTYPASINNFGQVASTVGVFTGHSAPQASTWTRSGDWQTLDQNQWLASWAYGINSLGDVVGYAYSIQSSHAVLWTNGTIWDLGTFPGGTTSVAYGINASGQIVGSSNGQNFPANSHAFLKHKHGSMKDLGTLPGGTDSTANAINFFGAVVGSSNSQSSPQVSHAFLWTKTTGMWDLNDLIAPGTGWVLQTATGINVGGQIVGGGTINGVTHGFLLTPNRMLGGTAK